MNEKEKKKIGRRDFLKKTGAVSLAAGAATLGGVSLATAAAKSEDGAIARYWQKKQKEYEAKEKKLRKAYKAFGPPPKYIYRETDWADDKATFYAPLQVHPEIWDERHRSISWPFLRGLVLYAGNLPSYY